MSAIEDKLRRETTAMDDLVKRLQETNYTAPEVLRELCAIAADALTQLSAEKAALGQKVETLTVLNEAADVVILEKAARIRELEARVMELESEAALQALATQAQELDMGYGSERKSGV